MLKEIRNLKEKQLIIARQIIKGKNREEVYRENDAFNMWNKCFPGDFKMDCKYMAENMKDAYNNKWQECYLWVSDYAREHTLEECDKDLNILRRKQERELKNVCKHTQYGAKLVVQRKNQLAIYIILKKEFCKRSNFYGVMEYMKKYKK